MPFFDDALAAAKISPEAFAAEFEKPGADANANDHVFDGRSIGTFLIHTLIYKIDDTHLPSLLDILITHRASLEVEDPHLYRQPLATAFQYLKPLTVNFLIAHNVILGQGLKQPALCNFPYPLVVNSDQEDVLLEMIKTFIETHQVDSNIQNEDGKSPLHEVAKNRYLKIISYLLSKDTESKSLFLQNKSHQTALGIVYEEFIAAGKTFSEENHPYVIHSKACLDLFMKAVYQYLYKKIVHFKGTEEELSNALEKDLTRLAGDQNSCSYQEAPSTPLRKFLDKKILKPLLIRAAAEREQRFAICLGFVKRLTAPTIHAGFFSHPLFDKNALATIFSFTHGIIPTPLKEQKTPIEMEKDNRLTLR